MAPLSDSSTTRIESIEALTLAKAVELAMANNPELARFDADVHIAGAVTLQSGLRPNPELELELEEFGGSGDSSGFEEAETTFLVSQKLELGNKRKLRKEVSRFGEAASQMEYQTARLRLIANVSRSFTEVLAAQQRMKLLSEAVTLASEALSVADKRVESGAASSFEQLRAQSVLAAAEIDLKQEKRALEVVRMRLVSQWGSSDPDFKSVSGELSAIQKLPDLEVILSVVEAHPELELWARLVDQGREKTLLENSKRVPDVTVGVGLKHYNRDESVYGVLQFSMPFPLFDRNQGNREKALHELRKTQESEREARTRLYSSVKTLHSQLQLLEQEISMVEQWLVAAKSAQEKTWRAYREGKASYLEVIEAQRMLSDAHLRRVDMLETYQNSWTNLRLLTDFSAENCTPNFPESKQITNR